MRRKKAIIGGCPRYSPRYSPLFPDKASVRLGKNVEEESPLRYEKVTDAVTLGPGQKFQVDFIVITHFKSAEDAKRNLALIAGDQEDGILISTAANRGKPGANRGQPPIKRG